MHFQHVFGQAFGVETRIAGVVFGLVAVAMLVAFWESRRGRGASGRAEHNPLELGYLGVLVAVVGFVVYLSFSANGRFWRDPPPAMTAPG
jgi:hypothetical protein